VMPSESACRGWPEGLAVVAGALTLRAAVLLLAPHALQTDPDGYRTVGENLLRHGVLGHGPQPTAVRPPLYPLILAGCAVFGPAAPAALGLVHLAMGTATVWLAWDLARMGRLRGWQRCLGAALVAGDPLLVRASTLVMTETLAALLATASLNLWARYLRQPTPWRAALLGALAGLGVLCRPHWLLWALATAGGLLICPPGRKPRRLPLPDKPPDDSLSQRPLAERPLPEESGPERLLAERPLPDKPLSVLPPSNMPSIWKARWAAVALYAVGAGVFLIPWTVRNAVQLGHPVLTTTHGGYTMLLANNRWLYEHLRQGGRLADWDPARFHQAWHQTVQQQFLLKSAAVSLPEPASTGSANPREQPRHPARMPAPASPLSDKPVAEEPSGKRDAISRGDASLPKVDELAADQWAYREAIGTISENPGIFCRAVLFRWGRLWQVGPTRSYGDPLHRVVYIGSFCWYFLEFILAIWGIWVIYTKRRGHLALRNTLLLALVWAGVLTAVHAFYWTEMRMRSTLTAGLALAAAFGAALHPCGGQVRLILRGVLFIIRPRRENSFPL